MIYIITLLFSMVLALYISLLKIPTNTKKYMYCISFIPLTILGAIRYYVGIDYGIYSHYQIPMVLGGSTTVKFEFLAKQIVYLGYFLAQQNHYIYIFAIIHIVIMYFMYKYIVSDSLDVGMSLFLLVGTGFYNFALSGMRQAIATMIVFYGVTKLQKQRYYQFVFLVCFATLFHVSAAVYIVLVLLERVRIKDIFVVIGSVILWLFSYISGDIVSSLMLNLGFYEEYVGSDVFYGQFHNLHQLYTLAVSFLIMILCRTSSVSFRNEHRIYININYLLVIIAVLMPVIPTPTRVVFMFSPVWFVLVPNLIKNLDNKLLKFVAVFIISVVTIFFFIEFFIVRNNYGAFPYRTIFDY